MTNGVSSASVSSAYTNSLTKNASNAKEGARSDVSKNETAKSKIETIKEKIASGEYEVDIDSLAKKMAEELLS